MAVLQRHQDHAVIDADRRAVGEGEIVGARRQADVVDDQLAVAARGSTSRILSSTAWKMLLGRLDARAGRRADMELDQAAVDQPGRSRGRRR